MQEVGTVAVQNTLQPARLFQRLSIHAVNHGLFDVL